MRRLLPERFPQVDSNILGEDSVTILPPSMCLLAPYLVKISLYDTKHVNFTCMDVTRELAKNFLAFQLFTSHDQKWRKFQRKLGKGVLQVEYLKRWIKFPNLVALICY